NPHGRPPRDRPEALAPGEGRAARGEQGEGFRGDGDGEGHRASPRRRGVRPGPLEIDRRPGKKSRGRGRQDRPGARPAGRGTRARLTLRGGNTPPLPPRPEIAPRNTS